MGKKMTYVLGYDIGGTKCAALLAQIKEDEIIFLARNETATSSDYATVLKTLTEFSHKQLELNGLTPSDIGIGGISCGGPLDAKKGLILSPPNLNGWDSVPVCEIMQREFGVEFHLKNDADACAVAEWKYGAGRGCDNVIFLTFGTGLGAGLILNGALYEGSSFSAGECGHIRLDKSGPVGYGKEGSFEGYCSGNGIKQLANGYYSSLENKPSYWKGENSLSAKDVAALAKNGDIHAKKIYDICGERFGEGLSVLIDILNPEVIVVGGIYMRDSDLITPSMYGALERECLPSALKAVKILPSQLGEKIGDYGAVVAALEN